MVDAQREQCASTADCRARGGAFALSQCIDALCVAEPAWACVEQPASTAAEGNGPFVVRIPVVDVVNQKPFVGVTARRYEKIDSETTSPLGGSETVSNESGMLEFQIERGFNGFITLEHSAIGPSLYFFNPPIDHDQTVAPVRLTSTAGVAMLLKQVGVALDPATGFVVLTAETCLGAPAKDVSYVASDAKGPIQAFYSVDGLPSILTTATDPSGYGGLVGVQPGNVAITGRQTEHGAIGGISLFTKPSTVSYSRMVPSAAR